MDVSLILSSSPQTSVASIVSMTASENRRMCRLRAVIGRCNIVAALGW